MIQSFRLQLVRVAGSNYFLQSIFQESGLLLLTTSANIVKTSCSSWFYIAVLKLQVNFMTGMSLDHLRVPSAVLLKLYNNSSFFAPETEKFGFGHVIY